MDLIYSLADLADTVVTNKYSLFLLGKQIEGKWQTCIQLINIHSHQCIIFNQEYIKSLLSSDFID